MATTKSKISRGSASSGRTPARSQSEAPRATGGAAPSRSTQVTIDHDEIQEWAEDRGAHPACVKETRQGETCLLRFDFPGYSGEESLESISWDEFFKTFDKNKLALLYQETTAGGELSNFNKIVRRDSAGVDEDEDEEDDDRDEDDEEEEEDER